MKVPIKQESVETNSGVGAVQTPQFTRPPADAFGANVAQAQGQIGQAVQQAGEVLQNHMVKRYQQQQDEKAYSLTQQAEEAYTQKLYSDEDIDYTDPETGQTRKIKSGVMRRNLHDAHGAALEVKTYKDAATKQFLDPYKKSPYIYNQVRRGLDTVADNAYTKAITHEANESDKAMKFTYTSAFEKKMQQMGIAENDAEAERMLTEHNGVLETGKYVEGLGGGPQDGNVSKGVENYVINQVRENGDTTAAEQSASKFNQYLKDPNLTRAAIAGRSANNKKIFEARRVEQTSSNRVQTLMDLAKGKKFDQLGLNGLALKDPELSKTVGKIQEFMVDYNPKTPIKEQPIKGLGLTPAQAGEMRQYAKSITGVFMQNDNETLSNFMINELNKKADGLTSSQKLTAFSNLAALKFAANNPQTAEDFKSADWLHAIKEGLNYLQTTSAYLFPSTMADFIVKNYNSKTKDKDQVMAQAKGTLRNAITDRHKAVSTLPSVPNKIVDGEQAVEDLQSGPNELEGEPYSGDYGDQSVE